MTGIQATAYSAPKPKLLLGRRPCLSIADKQEIEPPGNGVNTIWEIIARRRRIFKQWAARPENKAKQRVWQMAYKKRDPERRRQQNQVHNNRQRAKRLGRENTLQYFDWLAVLERYVHSCAFCGASNCLLDLEHLDSLDAGGHNVPGNVVPLADPCNAQKWRKTLAQFCAERNLDESAIRSRAAIL